MIGWQLKTRKDQFRFTVVVSVTVLMLSLVLRSIIMPPDLVKRTLVPDAAMALMIAVPITWIIGRRLREVQDLSTRLEHALDHDLLTGVHTRASFYKRIGALQDVPCGVIVVDIDHFKGFNDRHGHFAGDQALRQFAAILTSNCRNADIVARFGGEEFVIVLRGADLDAGYAVADRLARRVRKSPIFFGAQSLQLTASFGVAALSRGEDVDTVLQQADRALYRAKHAGRDRAVVHDPECEGDTYAPIRNRAS
ncbi:GGDEF domain-containing protein [Roseovarius tibetensis]|uniref:GGDEF domain-containing protein n=1 Tax=Roseovarius tibetensis TaxID=2685897 RepID=UPI003D7F27C2